MTYIYQPLDRNGFKAPSLGTSFICHEIMYKRAPVPEIRPQQRHFYGQGFNHFQLLKMLPFNPPFPQCVLGVHGTSCFSGWRCMLLVCTSKKNVPTGNERAAEAQTPPQPIIFLSQSGHSGSSHHLDAFGPVVFSISSQVAECAISQTPQIPRLCFWNCPMLFS